MPSLTAVIGWLAPVYTPALRTRRSPDVLAAGTVTVLVDEPALCTRTGPGGAGFTVREKVVAWVADDPVPVTVIGKVPVGVDVDVVTVMVELCPALRVEGLNETTAPDGAPVALSATDWVAPLVTAVVMVGEVPDPAVTVAEVGEAAMEKSLGGGGGAPALNNATPAAQYMAVPKLPA